MWPSGVIGGDRTRPVSYATVAIPFLTSRRSRTALTQAFTSPSTAARDLRVREVRAHQGKHLAFAWGERGHSGPGPCFSAQALCPEAVDHLARHLR